MANEIILAVKMNQAIFFFLYLNCTQF